MPALNTRTGPALAALTLLVSGAHLWVLQVSGLDWTQSAQTAIAPPLQTRSITLPPATADTAPGPAATPKAPRRAPPASTNPAPPSMPTPATTLPAQGNVVAGDPAQATVETPPPPAPEPPPPDSGSAPSAMRAVVVPASTVLRYDVQGTAKGLQYHAGSELTYQQDGQQYEARLSISAFLIGSRTDMSQGKLGSAGLEPTRYAMKSRSERAAHFVRDKGVISFSSNRPDAALQPGAQDRLSVLIQLAGILAADPKTHQGGTKLNFQVASADGATPWQFHVEGMEDLDLPIGKLAALRLVRQPRTEYDQRVEVWMSSQHAWLPARIRITNANGDTVDQLLRNAQR